MDLKSVMGHVHQVIADIYREESPDILREKGIDVFFWGARFIDPYTIMVGEERLSASRYLITTGARATEPLINGLEGVPYLTFETIWEIDVLPIIC